MSLDCISPESVLAVLSSLEWVLVEHHDGSLEAITGQDHPIHYGIAPRPLVRPVDLAGVQTIPELLHEGNLICSHANCETWRKHPRGGFGQAQMPLGSCESGQIVGPVAGEAWWAAVSAVVKQGVIKLRFA